MKLVTGTDSQAPWGTRRLVAGARVCVTLGIAAVLALACAPTALAAPFVTPVDISDGTADVLSMDAAMGPTGSAVIVWAEGGGLKARTRLEPGPFNAAATVANATTPHPGSIRAAVLNSGRYAVVWTQQPPVGNAEVWYSMAGPGGDLGPAVEVSSSNGGHSPEIAADPQGHVTIAYVDATNNKIKSNTILQGQTDFDPEVTVSTDALGTETIGTEPTVAAFDRTGVTIGWTTGGLVRARTRPSVANPVLANFDFDNFGTTQEITTTGSAQFLNSDASPDGHASIAWATVSGTSQIRVAVRDTAAGSFSLSSPDPLSSNANGSAGEPFVGLDDSGNTTVAWERNIATSPSVTFRTEVATRAAGAPNFAGITEVSGSDHPLSVPDLAVAGNGAAITGWRESSKPFAALRPAAGSFTDSQQTVANTSSSTVPKVAIDGSSNSLVVWTIPNPSNTSNHMVQASTNHPNGFNAGGANAAPVLTATGTDLTYVEDAGAVPVDPGLTLDDPENDSITGASVRISGGHVQADDELKFTNQAGITGSYNDSTGLLTLTGTASEAAYQTALRSVTYTNTSQNPSGGRAITIDATDGGSPSETSDAVVRFVQFTTANDRPQVAVSGGSVAWVKNHPSVALDPSLSVQDPDDTHLETAVVQVNAGFEPGDVLEFEATGGITGSYNASNGDLTLTGHATVVDYQTVMRSVRFRSDGDATGSRTVEYGVDDGTIGSTPVSKTVQVLDPGPQAQVSPDSLSFGEAQVGAGGTTKKLKLTNGGSQPLVVAAVNISGDGFSLSGGSAPCVRSLAPLESCELTVAFDPPSAGQKNGVVEFSHNASGSPTQVGVVGTGIAPAPQHFTPSPAFQPIPPSPTLPPKALPDFRPYVSTSACPLKKRSYPVRKGKKVVIESKRFRICDEEDVYSILAKQGLGNVRVVPQSGHLNNVKKVPGLDIPVERLQSIIDHGDVVEHSPDAGTELTPPNMWLFHAGPKEVPVLFVNVFRQRQKTLTCGSPELVDELTRLKEWPGRTTGSGNQREFGASDLLRELKCSYRVDYVKDKAATSIELKKVRGKKPMRLTVTVPRTLELSAVPVEGAFDDSKALDRLVSLVPADAKGGRVGPPVMPVTPEGQGGLVIEVKQTNTSPSVPIAGATVRIDDPDGAPIATSQKLKTDSNGEVPITAAFPKEGTYTIHAQIEGENGLTLDGEGKLTVDEVGKRVVTASGRIFRLKDGKWVLQKPVSASRVSSTAAGPLEWCGTKYPAGHWKSKDAFLDFYAGTFVADLVYAKTEMVNADWMRTDPELVTAAMINTYLAAQKAGFLERKEMRDFLAKEKLEVSHIGPGRISDVDVCEIFNFWLDYATTGFSDDPVTIQDLPRVGPGFDINKGAVPVVESGGDWVLPDGKVVRKFGGAASFVIRFPDFPEGSLQLSVYDRGLAIIGLLQKEGIRLTTEQIDAIFAVLASGGGNVIASGGGNVIASGGGNLSEAQVKAIFRIIASGGGNVIASNRGNFTDAQEQVVDKIISEVGGAIIGEGGASIKTPGQLKGLLAVIASGGGNLIGEAGTNLTAGQRDVINQLIGEAGTNLIGEAGTNFQLDAFQGVIASGGGNLTQGIVDGMAAVIASGGGNLIGEAGTNLTQIVSSFLIDGGNVIASGGGNIIASDGASLVNPTAGNFFSKDALKQFGQGMVEVGKFVATNSGTFVPTSGGNLIGEAGTNLISDGGAGRK